MLRKHKDGTYRTRDGQFTVRKSVSQGTTFKYVVRDERDGRTYRARTLEGCRETIRDLRGD